MVNINKNSLNSIVLTLFERTTIDDPAYLLMFTDKEKEANNYCLLGSDLSSNKERYNKFQIEDITDPNFLQSEVDLSVGDHEYRAYQLTQEQADGLENVEDVNTDQYLLVEGPGLARVKEESESDTYYSGPINNTVYGG